MSGGTGDIRCRRWCARWRYVAGGGGRRRGAAAQEAAGSTMLRWLHTARACYSNKCGCQSHNRAREITRAAVSCGLQRRGMQYSQPGSCTYSHAVPASSNAAPPAPFSLRRAHAKRQRHYAAFFPSTARRPPPPALPPPATASRRRRCRRLTTACLAAASLLHAAARPPPIAHSNK